MHSKLLPRDELPNIMKKQIKEVSPHTDFNSMNTKSLNRISNNNALNVS